jgi:hypothetical protein
MIKFTVVVREVGRLKPDYSLDFQAPTLPREGEYISIQRPDRQSPYGEDMIVRKVWWRLLHAETGAMSQMEATGAVDEIYVECEPASGPWSSAQWLRLVEGGRTAGHDVPAFDVARLSIPEPE